MPNRRCAWLEAFDGNANALVLSLAIHKRVASQFFPTSSPHRSSAAARLRARPSGRRSAVGRNDAGSTANVTDGPASALQRRLPMDRGCCDVGPWAKHAKAIAFLSKSECASLYESAARATLPLLSSGGGRTLEMILSEEQTGQLSEIFTPTVKRETDRLYGKDVASATFVHYTSAETALKIIREKRLWMRNATSMSDYREISHGHDTLVRIIGQNDRFNRLKAAVEECASGTYAQAIEMFDKNWADTLFNTFITSLSEHDVKRENQHGRLSMWRSFAVDKPRVALTFSIPKASKITERLSLIFAPVRYADDAQMADEFDAVIKNIEANKAMLCELDPKLLHGFLFTMLLLAAVTVKHPGFHEEREWRAIHGPYRWHSEIMEQYITVEPVFGVPQRIYKIPLDASAVPGVEDLEFSRIFERIIIGPSAYGSVMEDAFIRALLASGVKDAHSRVVISDIPIRP